MDASATRLGGLHSARCILLSVDFAEIEELQATGHRGEPGVRKVLIAARTTPSLGSARLDLAWARRLGSRSS